MKKMLKIFLTGLTAAAFSALQAGGIQIEPAKLFAVRGGMPNLAAKLSARENVNIVFIGGSITEIGGYAPNGYVKFVEKWLKEHYPKANIKVFNAGVSGTMSDYGAKRYERDVLSRNPDAVFIEFSVNDGQSDMTPHMERMVHKSWLKNPNIDLAFFYTLDKSHLNSYKAGKLPFAASCHEKVAIFYNIPTIGTAFSAAEKVNSGAIKWSEFSGDNCHPNANGYKIFDDVFAQALPELLKSQSPQPHKLEKSITANLQVYPPPIKVKPLAVPTDFKVAGDKKATKIFPLPVPAENWIGDSSYSDADGKQIWRISCLPRSEGGKLDGTTGMDKSQWDGKAAIWFAEDKCFTGASGGSVFSGSTAADSVRLGLSPAEVGILRFIAPVGGHYVFKVKSGPFNMWANDSAPVVFSVLKFTWNKDKGELLGIHKEIRKDRKGIAMDFSTDLLAGEEVVFVPDIKLPNYIRGGWQDLKIVAALLGK